MRHRLRALWFADIVGYTSLSARDEGSALAAVAALQAALRATVPRESGRVVKTMGDGALAEFDSTGGAVRAALALRDAYAERVEEAGLEGSRLRVGVHVGDVATLPDGDLIGDGVNVAARIQQAADPDQVLVGEEVQRQLRSRAGLAFEPVGERELKGVPEPVRLYTASAGPGEAHRPRAAVPAAAERTIAVLPFANLSKKRENEYFADGITEDILTALSKIGALRVVSRTSVMRYKRTEKSLPAIAGELGADLVLEGSARRHDDRVRVTAQLIDARTDAHLWAESYDRDLVDALALQEEIAERIAAALESRLSEGERRRMRAGRTADPAAWDLYMRGRERLHRFDTTAELDDAVEATRAAIALFERALEVDPVYVYAHAGIALARANFVATAWGDEDEEFDRAVASAREAIALGPEVAEGYFALGTVYHERFMERSALRQLRRAVELDPSHAGANDLLAWAAFFLGDLVEAVRHAIRAARIEPTVGAHHALAGRIWMELGDLEEAERWIRRSLEVEPEGGFGHDFLVQLHLRRGEIDEAEAALDRALELLPGSGPVWSAAVKVALVTGEWEMAGEYLERWAGAVGEAYRPWPQMAYVARKLDRPDEAERLLERAEERARRHLRRGFEGWDPHRRYLVQVLSMKGEVDEALEALEESVDRGWLPHRRDRIMPMIENLRADPRWEAIEERMEEVLAEELERARAEVP